MEKYNITGMSCAACVARVEKAVKGVPGVLECSVNLLTATMNVEGSATSAEIIRAVSNAGYGATPSSIGAVKGEGEKNSELAPLIKRLI